MADEAVRAPALGGVTERLDAQYDAHGADDDGVPITRSEGTKQLIINKIYIVSLCVWALPILDGGGVFRGPGISEYCSQ